MKVGHGGEDHVCECGHRHRGADLSSLFESRDRGCAITNLIQTRALSLLTIIISLMFRGTRLKGNATLHGVRDAFFRTSLLPDASYPMRDVTSAMAGGTTSEITAPMHLYHAETPFLNLERWLPCSKSHLHWSFQDPVDVSLQHDPFERWMSTEVLPLSKDVIEMFCGQRVRSTKMRRKRMMKRHKHRKRLKKNRNKTKR